MQLVELRTEAELREAFPIMRELRPYLVEERYLELLGDMLPHGYRLFGLRESGNLVALAGVELLTNLYYGRHVWVYDLVTTAGERSRGCGKRLLEYVEDFARAQRCDVVALSSGVERTGAHRFYEKHMGYDRPSYVFTKVIGDLKREAVKDLKSPP